MSKALKKMRKLCLEIGCIESNNFKHFFYLRNTMSERVYRAKKASPKLKAKFIELLNFAILQSIKDGLLTVEEIKATLNI